MKKRLEENRVLVDIFNKKDLLNVGNFIINILKDKEIVDEISGYNDEVEGLMLVFGQEVDGEFIGWTMKDLGMELDLEHYDEDINESYVTYLTSLAKVDGGREKIIEIIDTILADEYLREMYENEFIFIHETPIFILAKRYPEYKYYLGKAINEMPLSSMDHWYLELGRELIRNMTNGKNSMRLFAEIFASPCFVEVFEDEYEDYAEVLIEKILADEGLYSVFLSQLKDRVEKTKEFDSFLEKRKEFLVKAELDLENTGELMEKLSKS